MTELTSVIQSSFTPEPVVVVLKSVTDTKRWMHEQTPPLHDHLKAHQFKFIRNESEQCRMYYKEWSTDEFWLPQTGLVVLPVEKPVPTSNPLMIQPYFDPENFKKLETTLRKVSVYLDKASVAGWWKSWLEESRKHMEPLQPQVMEG